MRSCDRLKIFAKRLAYLWRCGDTRPATICVILSGFLWTAMLLAPGDTIARPTYLHMRQIIASDTGWAAVFAAVATLQLWRLFADTGSRGKWLDFALKITACFLYGFTAVACITSISPIPAAMADNVVIALAAWWDLYRWDVRRGCGARHYPSGDCPLETPKHG